MTRKLLIDITDARFHVPANEDVLAFVREANPFAHTGVGSVLLALGRDTPGALPYCPSYEQCAYVVLHTASHHIFAIAFGQRGLAFRLGPAARAEALSDGGEPAPAIGPDWVQFAPWDPPGSAKTPRRLRIWCARAFADALNAKA